MTTDEYYQGLYADSAVERSTKKTAQKLLNLVEENFKDKEKILDAGCGNGHFAALLAKNKNVEVTGMDISISGIKRARRLGIKVIQGDLQSRFPFKSGSFDIVFSNQVLEHLLNPDIFLEECNRVLKSNGRLILSTPNLAAWFNRFLLVFGVQPFFMESSTIDKTIGLKFTRRLTKERQTVGHIRIFTKGALKDILQLHHFTVQSVVGYSEEYFPSAIILLDRIIAHIPSLASNLLVVAVKNEH